jgi:hypothetical protein
MEKLTDLSAFPHRTMEHKNGKIEVYFTEADEIDPRFEGLSAHRVKYHGFMRFKKDQYGYYKQPMNRNESIDANSYDVRRNNNDEKAVDMGTKRIAEIIGETATEFVRRNPQLLIDAANIAKNKEIVRLKNKLDKAATEQKWKMFDRIEARIFTLSLEQKNAPYKPIPDRDLGIE